MSNVLKTNISFTKVTIFFETMIVPRTKNFIFSFSPEIFKYTNQRCCQVYIQFHLFLCVLELRRTHTKAQILYYKTKKRHSRKKKMSIKH